MIVLPCKEINPVSFNTSNIIHVSLGNLERVPVLRDHPKLSHFAEILTLFLSLMTPSLPLRYEQAINVNVL